MTLQEMKKELVIQMYVGTIGKKVITEVVLVGDYEFQNTFVSWNPTTNHIYTMKDTEGNIFVYTDIRKQKYSLVLKFFEKFCRLLQM